MPMPSARAANADVLDRASNGGQVHFGQCAASENMLLAAIHQRHHQQFAALAHPLHFQPHEFIFAFAQSMSGIDSLLLNHLVNGGAQPRVRNPDKPPRLHEADAGSQMRGTQ